jgi:membrane-bound ClpP family serine protease
MSSASNIVKMLIGIVLLVVGLVWYLPKGYGLGFYTELISLLEATIGLFLLFVGLIVAWMGYDDYKMDKEMAQEEKKEGKKE